MPRHLPPVGHDMLPGNKRRLLGREEINHIRHILRLSKTIERNQSQIVFYELRIRDLRLVGRRVDYPGTYCVRANPIGP